MTTPALVIDMRPPPPRKVGGGLDAPDAPAPAAAKARRRLADEPRPTLGPARPAAAPAPAAQPTPAPASRPKPAPPATTAPAPAPTLAPEVDTAAEELAAVRSALLAITPVGPGPDTLALVRIVAAKLDGHRDCHRLLNPGLGSATIDEVRARCLKLLDQLRPAERQAVVALLADDTGGAHITAIHPQPERSAA